MSVWHNDVILTFLY